MVPDPEQFDDNGYLKELSPGGKEEFQELYKDNFRAIDPERVQRDLENQITQIEREIIESAQSIVGGFHPRRRSQDGASEFEFEFFSPLCEIGQDGGDLLMARADYNALHICIVTCEVGGESLHEWIYRVNDIDEVIDSAGLDRLKRQLGCSSHSVETIQYVTLAREVDLAEFNYSEIDHLVEVENHCFWERDRDNQEFRFAGGTLGHQDLTEAIEHGFDYGSVGAPTIQYLIRSHPVLVLEEVVFKVVTDNLSQEDDHPQEFNREDFRERYESSLELGIRGDEYENVVESKVDEILQFGVDINLIDDNAEEIDSQRDFDLKFSGEKPHMAKKAVMGKYLNSETPIERGRRAYSRTDEEFDPPNTELGDF